MANSQNKKVKFNKCKPYCMQTNQGCLRGRAYQRRQNNLHWDHHHQNDHQGPLRGRALRRSPGLERTRAGKERTGLTSTWKEKCFCCCFLKSLLKRFWKENKGWQGKNRVDKHLKRKGFCCCFFKKFVDKILKREQRLARKEQGWQAPEKKKAFVVVL